MDLLYQWWSWMSVEVKVNSLIWKNIDFILMFSFLLMFSFILMFSFSLAIMLEIWMTVTNDF